MESTYISLLHKRARFPMCRFISIIICSVLIAVLASCKLTKTVEPYLVNYSFTDDYTGTLQIASNTAYVSLPYTSTLSTLKINGRVLWGPDFVMNAEDCVIYQFDRIYGTNNGMGVYRDTTNYVLTLGEKIYSGTLINPSVPHLNLPEFDLGNDYHFTWDVTQSPDNFWLNVGFFGGSPEENVQLSSGKRSYSVNNSHWTGQGYAILRITLRAFNYVRHGHDLIVYSHRDASEIVTPPER